MNEQKARGTLVRARGSIESFLGRLTGNRRQRVAGVTHTVEGAVRRGVGDLQEAMEHHEDPAAAKR